MRARGTGRGVVGLGMLLLWSPCALALNPALDVSQYAHNSWKIRDGFFKGTIASITQTPDGYLWLGTELGLLRFDGVRTVEWLNGQLPSNKINNVLAARDGTLWIATSKGLASWKDSKLTLYPEFAGQWVRRLLEDREGSIWAGAGSLEEGRLCAIRKGSVQCYGEDGRFGVAVLALYEDSMGNLWAGAQTGLWRWQPDPPKLYPSADRVTEIQSMIQGDNGALWIAMREGVRQIVDEKVVPCPIRGAGAFSPNRMFRDREGSLWIGTLNRGLIHLHQGKTDVFAPADGLSGESVTSIFEDREGNIWVATHGGLDRFREFAVATFSVNQGLSDGTVNSVLPVRDGSIWVGTSGGLNRWNHGQFTVYRANTAHSANGTPGIAVSGLPTRAAVSLFQDVRGRIWVSTTGELGYLEHDRWTPVRGGPNNFAHHFAEDTAGTLWAGDVYLGVFRLSPGDPVEAISRTMLGGDGTITALATDPLQGGLWIGFLQGGVAYWKDGRVRASYGAGNGLGGGRVNDLRIDRDGTLWVATQGGLSRLQNGRFATLNQQTGLPCDGVLWVIEDVARSLWVLTSCGLAKLPRPQLNVWTADPNHPVQATVFGVSDGVRSLADTGVLSTPHVAKLADGTLWFGGVDGISVIDPLHIPVNNLPPPVHIEQVTADRKPYDLTAGMRLPALIRDLQIDYTALSLAAPEKVRFRYLLEGHDREWQDAGTRRQAFYNDLPPHNYRFRVIACNNSGVWNETGASMDFTVAPAYYQTTWFLAACIGAALMALAALYQLRLQYVKQQFNLRLEERVAERTRIARDFHDTTLQSFQAALMMFSVVANRIKDPPEAKERLEAIVEQARKAVTEGRDAVQGLRSSTVVTNDLARAIHTLGEELSAGLAGDQAGPACPEFRVRVEGTTRDLAPLVRDDVHRIACEAVRNAFRHAQASRIEVEIHYDRRHLRLRVVDNGKGIDPSVAGEGGRPGHYGLSGMRERAKLVGGELALLSRRDSGTEVALTIPAALAYTKSPVTAKPMFPGKGT